MNTTTSSELTGRVIRNWQRCAASAVGTHGGQAFACAHGPHRGTDAARETLRDVFESVVGQADGTVTGGDDWLATVLATAARQLRPASSDRVLAEAFTMAASADAVAAFARASRYDSVNPSIIGDHRDQSKDHVFAGDVLWSAGFAVPTHDVGAGERIVGQQYERAHRWPAASSYFQKLTTLADVRPGDLLVIRPAKGDGPAHVEIITRAERHGSGMRLSSMGARHAGLREDAVHAAQLTRATPVGDHWEVQQPPALVERGCIELYVLRPLRAHGEADGDDAAE